MPAPKILADPTAMKRVASEVDGLRERYQGQVDALYSSVGAIGSGWTGADQDAYRTQIDQFRDDFTEMVNLLRSYTDYLNKSAQQYATEQQNIASDARSLRTDF
ncbi:MAG: WXG100 family type VII secretion target [Coriobacteriia bacterium]|nr:WXG100 family type VII secretion target [Coriobacteriia bacterium]